MLSNSGIVYAIDAAAGAHLQQTLDVCPAAAADIQNARVFGNIKARESPFADYGVSGIHSPCDEPPQAPCGFWQFFKNFLNIYLTLTLIPCYTLKEEQNNVVFG
jgi:hypothetical protein